MMDNERKFNLLDEPWIKVMDLNLREEEVSLKTLFENAHLYTALSGETSTQNAALLRFLLAILMTVFYRYNPDGEEDPITEDDWDADQVLERWEMIWENGQFSVDTINKYLEKWRDRFWLFDPERPFYQVPNQDYGTSYPTSKTLFGDVKASNNKKTMQHFSLRLEKELSVMPFNEAARWLIHYNAYCVNVKWDKKYGDQKNKIPSEIGRLGNLGLIYIEGQNLFETLMLNLTPLKDGYEIWGVPKPVWERDQVDRRQGIVDAMPDNLPELYTIPSRRVELLSQSNKVTGYRALLGEHYERQNCFSEQMTIWRKYEKKGENPYYLPKLHDVKIQAWREFPALFDIRDVDHRPGLILWIERLIKEKMIEPSYRLQIRTVGMQYDSMKYLFVDSVSDQIALSYQILNQKGGIWIKRITDEIDRCQKTADCLKKLGKEVSNFLYGKTKQKMGEDLTTFYYYEINAPFKAWLYAIDPDNDDEEKTIKSWQEQSYSSAKGIAEKWIKNFASELFILKGEGKKKNSIPMIMNRFTGKLKKIYN